MSTEVDSPTVPVADGDPRIRPPESGERRYRAVVAYDGGAYHGFSPSPGVVTVGATLGANLARILGHEVPITCAGRTDKGVHAWGQVISFDTSASVHPPRLQHSLNRMCGPGIVVRELTEAAEDFDARFSARGRTYRYRILNRAVRDPFLHATTWHVRKPLDLEAMNAASRHLLGTHDFTSFCRRRMLTVRGDLVEATLDRRVLSIEWSDAGDDVVEHWISATAFCHQMVRSLTGTLVEVGLGKRSPDDLATILAARDRQVAGIVAPPHGLTLWDVAYSRGPAVGTGPTEAVS